MSPSRLAVGLLLATAVGAAEGQQCNFTVEPVFPGYFWDPSCQPGDLGCLADGQNLACRFCGGGAYANVSCAPEACRFVNEPVVPYYWDATCELGMLGCWADGVHNQCRFCGVAPYTSIPCPDRVGGAVAAACTFANEPKIRYDWDTSCTLGMKGCLADGVHENCRFCGEGAYEDVPCTTGSLPECTFANEPRVPYYWDPKCATGESLGCLADGVHRQCRYCGFEPFEPCPAGVGPPAGACSFADPPKVPYYWEPSCAMGVLGCWADRMHAECRFCESGVYKNITCPSSATFPTADVGAASAASGPGPADKGLVVFP